MTDLNRATFLATLPDIMTALNFGSDGARIKLDAPESEVAQVAKLIGMKGKVLRVTVEVDVEKHKPQVNY